MHIEKILSIFTTSITVIISMDVSAGISRPYERLFLKDLCEAVCIYRGLLSLIRWCIITAKLTSAVTPMRVMNPL